MSDYDGRELCEGRGNCLKYLKREVEQKRGEGKHRFKKGGGKLGQGVGTLKKGEGTGIPLRTMSHPMVLNMGLLDWESSTLTTRSLRLNPSFPKCCIEKQITIQYAIQ